MHKLIIVTFIILLNTIFALSSKLSGDYESDFCKTMYIGKFETGNYQLIDSVQLDSNGKFSIELPQEKAILLIACKNDKSPDKALNEADNTSSLLFVYDGQDIVYETSWRWHSRYLKIKEGGEPTKTIEFLFEKLMESQSQLAELEKVMDNPTTSSSLQQALVNEYSENIRKYNQIQSNLLHSVEKGSMLESSIMFLHQQEVPAGLKGDERISWLRSHFFDDIDLSNPLIYNNPFFSERVRQYLYIWQPKGISSKTAILESKQEGARLLLDKVNAFPQSLREAMRSVLSKFINL